MDARAGRTIGRVLGRGAVCRMVAARLPGGGVFCRAYGPTERAVAWWSGGGCVADGVLARDSSLLGPLSSARSIHARMSNYHHTSDITTIQIQRIPNTKIFIELQT